MARDKFEIKRCKYDTQQKTEICGPFLDGTVIGVTFSEWVPGS